MCYIPEIWKPIKGYEGLYEVSNLGEVRGVYKKIPYRDGFRNRQGKKLKQNNMKGYAQVKLQNKNQRKLYLVHRLVAEAFIPNPDNLPEVNHIDGNKQNNRVDNLEWCTRKENMIHSVEKHIRTDLKPVDMYSLNDEFICTFPSLHMASNKTGIIRNNISNCCKGKYGYKTAGGYKWKYHERGEKDVLYT